MDIKQALAKLEQESIPCLESNRKGYDYFIPADNDEIPINDYFFSVEDSQCFGVHLTEKQVIEFANFVK